MTPALESAERRWVKRLREMRGSPNWISLKRWLPLSSSRRISGVQRSAKISAPRDTGQNWTCSGTRPVNAYPRKRASSFFGLSPEARRIDLSRGPEGTREVRRDADSIWAGASHRRGDRRCVRRNRHGDIVAWRHEHDLRHRAVRRDQREDTLEQLAGADQHQGRIRCLDAGEPDRPGRVVRLALAPGATHRGRQEW